MFFGTTSFASDSDEDIFRMDDSSPEKNLPLKTATVYKKITSPVLLKASSSSFASRTVSETSYFSPKKEDRKGQVKKLSLSSSSNAVPVVLDTFLSIPYSPDLDSSDSEDEDIIFRFDHFDANCECTEKDFSKKKKNLSLFSRVKEVQINFPDIVQNSNNEKSVIFLTETEDPIIDVSCLAEKITAQKMQSTLILSFCDVPSFTIFLPEGLNVSIKNAYKSVINVDVSCRQFSLEGVQDSSVEVNKPISSRFTSRNGCSNCKINLKSISGDIESHLAFSSSVIVQSIDSNSVFFDLSHGSSCIFKAGEIQELDVFIRDEDSILTLSSGLDIHSPITGKIRCLENIKSEKGHASRCKIISSQSKSPRANFGFC